MRHRISRISCILPSRRNSTVSSMNDTPAATVEHHSSPVLPKKRTFSKFLGVLSSLAGSNSPASPSTPTTNHDTSPVNLSPAPPNPETTSMQPEAPSLKDTVKRVRSVVREEPCPQNAIPSLQRVSSLSRNPIELHQCHRPRRPTHLVKQHRRWLIRQRCLFHRHSPTCPVLCSRPTTSNPLYRSSHHTSHHSHPPSSSPHNHVPQTTFLQESRRHRSNSSPVDNVIIHK